MYEKIKELVRLLSSEYDYGRAGDLGSISEDPKNLTSTSLNDEVNVLQNMGSLMIFNQDLHEEFRMRLNSVNAELAKRKEAERTPTDDELIEQFKNKKISKEKFLELMSKSGW